MADRPMSSKSGAVSIDVPDSIMVSIDQVFDTLGLPEPGSLLARITPDYVLDVLDIPSPDDMVDNLLSEMDSDLGVNYPPER